MVNTQNSNVTFADEIKFEVRKAIEHALLEAKGRVEHFTCELDKRIEYMYKEQVQIKEAHEIGLAQAKAGYRLTERRSNLIAAQMEATLGIITETEKRVERMGWFMKGLERKKEKMEQREGGEVTEAQGPKNKGTGENKKSEEETRNDWGFIDKQGPRKTRKGAKRQENEKGSDADTEDSEEDPKKKGEKEQLPKETDKGKKILVPTTPEWGGWEDVPDLTPVELSQTTSQIPN